MFAGQEKNSFDKDAGINSLNSGNFYFQSLQMSTKLYSIYQLILPKSNYWTQKMQFWRNCRNIFAEDLIFLAQMRKNLNKIVTFSVNLFLVGVFREHQTMQFSQFCCNDFAILQRNEVLSAQSKIWSTNCKFFRETMFCEKLLWTRIKQFWRSLGNNFCCSQKFSSSNCKKWTKVYTFQQMDFSFEC